MQRRRSTSSFSPGISSFSHGSNVNNLGLFPQNVDSMNVSSHDNHTSISWTGPSSSSVISHNQVALSNGEHEQLPSPDARTGTRKRLLGESHSEPNGPSMLQSAISDAIPQKLDLNVAFEDSDGNIHREVGANSSLAGNAEIFERNTRRRVTPANERGFPSSSTSSLAHVNNTFQTLQPSYYNGITSPSSSSASASSPVILARGSDALRVEENSRYIPRSTSVQSTLAPGTLRNSPRNLSSQNGFSGTQLSAPPHFRQHNVTRGFQNGFTAGIHPSSTPSGFPHRNLAEEYVERLSSIVNHSTVRLASSVSEGQTTNLPIPSVGGRLESGVGNVRAFQAQPRPGVLMIRDEGHNAVMPSILPHVQPLGAAQLRATLIRRALQVLHWVEDGIIVHEPLFYEEPDVHENMRLDVDDMSYEELLALEDQIGNVSTGLSEEAILAAVRRHCYLSMKLGPPVEEEPCCICQEDYVDGKELGKLNCGHEFHFDCIKQWLVQKNNCPICKKTAVVV
ncbi:unnamed protein product [Camellia sinensis]